MRYSEAARRAALLPVLAAAIVAAGCDGADAANEVGVPSAAQLEPGSGNFIFDSTAGTSGRPVTVWYHLPAAATAESPVHFVMHGTNRNGEDYRDQWVDLSDEYAFVLVVPEFASEYYPGAASYNLGNMFTDGQPTEVSMWSYAAIEPIFDEVLARTGNVNDRYTIYGHSAGAQFVHRFLMFQPDTRAEAAVSANAGWYTMPDTRPDFPYGLGDLDGFLGRSADEWLGDALQRPMVVLLGDQDTDPDHSSLRRTPEAMAQGEHRFERGLNYFAAAEAEAERLGVPFAWRLETVPGVAHSNTNMAPAAAAVLWEGQGRANRE